MTRLHPVALAYIFFLCCVSIDAGKKKKPIPYEQQPPSSRFDNPSNIKDREKGPSKPPMPVQWKERNSRPFQSSWMEYCAPHNCASYSKPACGLNRKNMRFKWFNSVCHIILNNQCSYHRGLLKYDIIDAKFCYIYVMDLRSGCPRSCGGEVAPVCAWGPATLPVLFQNRCALEKANCRTSYEQYDEVKMAVCNYFWGQALTSYANFNADESTEVE